MQFGLWAFKNERWRIRPVYYSLSLMTHLIQPGAEVLSIIQESCDPNLNSAAIHNLDGTRTIYVINLSQKESQLRLEELPASWRPRRYLVTQDVTNTLSALGNLSLVDTDVTISDRMLIDVLPPRSLVAYSDAP